MSRLALTHATVFDSLAGVMRPGASVVIDGEDIVDVMFGAPELGDTPSIDLQGRCLLPGLIDAHVHVTAVHSTISKMVTMQPSLITAMSKQIMERMLMRGFTTVRDAAGADYGLVTAIDRGLLDGPRLFIAGHALSQTGGHGDGRAMGDRRMVCACAGIGLLGTVADGIGEVRKAAREQLRSGAHQIKIMAGGGVASPTDPIDGTQYSMDELRAICEEAEAANTYAMAHAYSPKSISRAIEAGVRTIEHGNLLDVAAARTMKSHGAFLVPTLATYDSLSREGKQLGWLDSMLEKLARVKDEGINAIRIANDCGVPVGFGTDLLGSMHDDQSNEFLLRAKVLSAAEILQSATSVNARILNQQGRLGVIAKGALADLVAVDGDPTVNLALMTGQGEHLPFIMKGGRIYKNRLA
jgi:imidazolonepropionase-like amidohydrolase